MESLRERKITVLAIDNTPQPMKLQIRLPQVETTGERIQAVW
jgi:hypothetical protein